MPGKALFIRQIVVVDRKGCPYGKWLLLLMMVEKASKSIWQMIVFDLQGFVHEVNIYCWFSHILWENNDHCPPDHTNTMERENKQK